MPEPEHSGINNKKSSSQLPLKPLTLPFEREDFTGSDSRAHNAFGALQDHEVTLPNSRILFISAVAAVGVQRSMFPLPYLCSPASLPHFWLISYWRAHTHVHLFRSSGSWSWRAASWPSSSSYRITNSFREGATRVHVNC